MKKFLVRFDETLVVHNIIYRFYKLEGSFSVSSSKSQDQVESGFLLDVVVGKGSSVLELLTSEDKSLLIWWDTFLVLDLGLDVLDGISWLDIKGDGLAGESLNENLHVEFL